MADSGCGCNNSASTKVLLSDVPAQCPAVVHETVCVQADVKITPNVTVGEIKSFCIDGAKIGKCPGTPVQSCNFTVSQSICVEVPLNFSANAEATPSGIVCGNPLSGECEEISGCTFTIGYFRNHPEVTNALIANAGGSIVLGVGNSGASFTVTTANANDVLSFMTPSPPAPPSPPLAQQYQQLYAQLLAANLNVLNGATCENALIAIANANSFLAASPAGIGMEGAPIVQEPLETFNSGNAIGCPGHCPDTNEAVQSNHFQSIKQYLTKLLETFN